MTGRHADRRSRRVLYAAGAGILVFNLAVIAGQYVEMQGPDCDVETRGLAVKIGGGWRLLQPGSDPDAEPCKVRRETTTYISSE